jgi:hypothetical protein
MSTAWNCVGQQKADVLKRHKMAEQVLGKGKRERDKIVVCLLLGTASAFQPISFIEQKMFDFDPPNVLGTGESGKSTVVKQMQIMHRKGFTDNEKQVFLPIINMNIVDALRILIEEAGKRCLEFENPQNKVYHLFTTSEMCHTVTEKLLACEL